MEEKKKHHHMAGTPEGGWATETKKPITERELERLVKQYLILDSAWYLAMQTENVGVMRRIQAELGKLESRAGYLKAMVSDAASMDALKKAGVEIKDEEFDIEAELYGQEN